MLSNRLHWLTCLLIAALVIPGVAAEDPGADPDAAADEGQAKAGEAGQQAQQTADELADEARQSARDNIDALRLMIRDARAAGGEGVDEAERQKEIAIMLLEQQLAELKGAADTLVDDAASQFEDLQNNVERRLPRTTTIWGEPTDNGQQEYSPQAQVAAPIELRDPLILVGGAVAAGLLFWLAGASSAAGKAGAAGAGAGAKDLRRLLPYASPLFTRFERDTVLGHPRREALYAGIMEKPGITLQDLCDETGLSRTAVSHHLRLLEQQHLVVSKRMGRSCHFFENGGRYGRDQKDAYAVLHNDRSKDVHEYINANPGAIQKDLCEALGIQASVAHWHVKRLQEASLIDAVRQGRTVSYFSMQTAQARAYA